MLTVPSKTFTVEIKIPNSDEALRPGMYGTIDFFIGNTETVVAPAIAVLKLQGSNWELNLRLSKEDIQTLHKGIKEADWSERKSIKAGATCLSVPIYWNYEEKNNIVCIILGEDDECWDVGFVISFSDFERIITTLIE